MNNLLFILPPQTQKNDEKLHPTYILSYRVTWRN